MRITKSQTPDPNINALNAVMLSLRLVRNPSEKERFPTSGNDKNVKTINAFVLNLSLIWLLILGYRNLFS
jgi:hypothetical protein